jgi:DNA transformation protein and related proteins
MPAKKAVRSSSAFAKRIRVSDGFRAFALDQLADTPRFTHRAMFGGVGLYSGDVFFGMLAGDALYLKTNDTTRSRYQDVGAQPFEPYPGRGRSMKYFAVPLAVLEDADELTIWVTESIRAAKR